MGDFMVKKIFCLLVSVCFAAVFFVGCINSNNNVETSSITQNEEISSQGSSKQEENINSSKVETSSVSNEETSSVADTSSDQSSSNKKPTRPTHNTSSVSSSQGVKMYKNPENIGLMSFSLNMRTTTALGNDYFSREYYFEQVVKEGYFNQYTLHVNEELLPQAKIIAKYGGSIWLYAASSVKGLEAYVPRVKEALAQLEENGLKDIVNGFFWDEPTLGNRMSLKDLETITGTLYREFGLRNHAVFGTAEFTKVESNTSVSSASKVQTTLTTESLKYVTDMGFDSYSIDVRDGASNGGDKQFAKWQKNCSDKIVDGKSFYTEHRKLLQKIANKPFNYWHWPSAWYDYLWGGLNGLTHADEGFWTAHLNFMARDILEQDNPGGLCIYTFRRVDKDTNVAFERRMDLMDEDTGEHLVYKDVEKYYIYSERLRFWKEYFDTKTPGIIK